MLLFAWAKQNAQLGRLAVTQRLHLGQTQQADLERKIQDLTLGSQDSRPDPRLAATRLAATAIDLGQHDQAGAPNLCGRLAL